MGLGLPEVRSAAFSPDGTDLSVDLGGMGGRWGGGLRVSKLRVWRVRLREVLVGTWLRGLEFRTCFGVRASGMFGNITVLRVRVQLQQNQQIKPGL